MTPNRCFAFVVASIMLGMALPAHGFNWWPLPIAQKSPPAVCPQKFCCDDYGPKPLPLAKGVHCFVCDDYCPKPLPHAEPVHCSVCDDYCPKALPVPTCPPRAAFVCPPAWDVAPVDKNKD